MTRWLSVLLAWCFVFLIAIDYTAIKPARQRSRKAYALHIGMLFTILLAFAFSLRSFAGDLPAKKPLLETGSQVRVQLLGDNTWHEGQVRPIEGCRMVFLIKPTRDGYTSAMLNGMQRLQVNRTSQWQELSLIELLKLEPARCREMGAY
jgi:hypothetical protein